LPESAPQRSFHTSSQAHGRRQAPIKHLAEPVQPCVIPHHGLRRCRDFGREVFPVGLIHLEHICNLSLPNHFLLVKVLLLRRLSQERLPQLVDQHNNIQHARVIPQPQIRRNLAGRISHQHNPSMRPTLRNPLLQQRQPNLVSMRKYLPKLHLLREMQVLNLLRKPPHILLRVRDPLRRRAWQRPIDDEPGPLAPHKELRR